MFQIDVGMSEGSFIIILSRDRFFFTSETFDVTFIQITDQEIKMINPGFLEPSPWDATKEKNIFIPQYPGGRELSLSFGRIVELREGTFEYDHNSSTEPGSSGSPLLDCDGKVVGVHKAGYYYVEKNASTTISIINKAIEGSYRSTLNKAEVLRAVVKKCPEAQRCYKEMAKTIVDDEKTKKKFRDDDCDFGYFFYICFKEGLLGLKDEKE